MKRLNITGQKSDHRFVAKMELLWAFMEHLGVLGGGGWNVEKRTANAFLEAHKASCCKNVPGLPRITLSVQAKITDWCQEHGLKAVWK